MSLGSTQKSSMTLPADTKLQPAMSPSTINVCFLNFWPGFHPKTSPLFKPLQEAIGANFIINNEKPDLVIHSVFNSTPPRKGVPNILMQLENGHHFSHRRNIYNLPSFGWVYDTDKDLEFPSWFENYDQLCNPVQQPERRNEVCSMFRNKTSEREAIINFYQAARINAPNKISAISQYVYNIAVENSYYPPYITEKLPQACMAGCIPIYAGGNLVHTPYNLNRIIFACEPLPRDHESMLQLPIFNDNHREMYEMRREKIRDYFSKLLG